MHRTHPSSLQAAPPDVERIVVASRIAGQVASVYDEMERIRQSSMRRNQQAGIHSALYSQNGWFVHWLEGPGPAVRALRERIALDPRHFAPVLLHHTHGQRYLLSRWSMMLNPGTEPVEIFGRRVEELHQSLRSGVQYPPTSVMRRLAAPLRLRPSGCAADPEAFHRVGVCSADEGRSFDLVRWLAERHRMGSHRRRVAGEADLDSASDYVEFMQDGQPVRVIAVSRAGLQHGLRRAFLPDWQHLLLLFGDDARRNTALMERVRDACVDLPARPDLLGVASDPGVHARMAVNARVQQMRYRPLGAARSEDHDEVWHAVREKLQQAGEPKASKWDLTHPSWIP